MDAQGIAAELELIVNHPRGVIGRMGDLEREKGFVPIPYGSAWPVTFSDAEWEDGVISVDAERNEIRLVAIRARVERRGALRRLLGRIAKAGYQPVIVEPIGPVMPALMRRWGWDCTLVEHSNEVNEEWREQHVKGG